MLTTLDEKLKFTMKIGGNNICFLDRKISIQNNRLETTVYSKPTDSHLYLQTSSCHKKSSKNGIIRGVALHLHRICSTMEEKCKNVIAKNVKSQVLGPQFHGNQDYVTTKVNSRRMFVPEEL